MPFMKKPVPFSLRYFRHNRSVFRGLGLVGALFILSACEPQKTTPIVAAPSASDTATGEAITLLDTTTQATEAQDQLEASQLEDNTGEDNTGEANSQEANSQEGSKIDPSVSYLSQQSDPIATEPNLQVLDQDIFSDTADQGNPLNSLKPKSDDSQDEIDSAIEWIFNDQAALSPSPPTSGDIAEPAFDGNAITSLIDDGFDYDSLEDVFAIISKPKIENIITQPPSQFPSKQALFTRAAVLLPLSGSYKSVGEELRKAVDMAVISLDRPQFEVIYIDTADQPAEAAYAAVAADADIIIGPVFSSHTAAVAPIAREHQIPVLSFSNNSAVTNQDVWIMGQQPEHEMEAVLSYAMASLAAIDQIPAEQARIAIVTNDTAYGRILRDVSINHLKTAGVTRISQLLLNQSVLKNEARLQLSIRQFARWSEEDPTPEFDMVIICGDGDFTLAVAPVLVWHDLDPAKVRFVGSSQWNRIDMITEPSLQGGLYATIPTEKRQRFEKVWKIYFADAPGDLAPLGFDAVAIASLMTADVSVSEVLLRDTGFAGFSGVFRFYPDGNNKRHLEVRQINAYKSAIVSPADTIF